jgi:hypothetical protein
VNVHVVTLWSNLDLDLGGHIPSAPSVVAGDPADTLHYHVDGVGPVIVKYSIDAVAAGT